MAKEIRSFVNSEKFSSKEPSEAYTEDGGKTWRWCSNNSYLMLDTCAKFGVPCDPVAQEAARSAQVDKFLESYRKNQPATPSPEEEFEMRAAFGPGAEVVDVITGRKWRT